jgi:hypothetical protein
LTAIATISAAGLSLPNNRPATGAATTVETVRTGECQTRARKSCAYADREMSTCTGCAAVSTIATAAGCSTFATITAAATVATAATLIRSDLIHLYTRTVHFVFVGVDCSTVSALSAGIADSAVASCPGVPTLGAATACATRTLPQRYSSSNNC